MRGARAATAAVLVLGWPLAAHGAAGGEEVESKEPRVIRVVGSATATASPDHAQIDLGVLTQADAATRAAGENAKYVDRVLGAVRKVLGAKADVKTISYSVTPTYGDAKPSRPPTVSGYSAQNIVRVETDELSQVSKVIDAATEAGANDVRGLQFTLKNEGEVRGRALRDAVAKARTEADTIASALGVKILRVRTAETAGEPPIVRPMMMSAAMARSEASPPTPVEPGTIEVHAIVTVTFEIAP